MRKWSIVAVGSSARLHMHAVEASSLTRTEIAEKGAEIIAPLSNPFAAPIFTVEEQSAVLDLCAKYRLALLINLVALGKCTTAEATFPFLGPAKHVSGRLNRAIPRTEP